MRSADCWEKRKSRFFRGTQSRGTFGCRFLLTARWHHNRISAKLWLGGIRVGCYRAKEGWDAQSDFMAVGHTVPGSLPRGGRSGSRDYESLVADLASPNAATGVESTALGVRSGMDVSVHVDGVERVAHLAPGKLEGRRGRSGLVLDSVGAQLRLVVSILRTARHRSGIRRDPAAVDDDYCYRGGVLLDFLFSRVVVDSVHCVGRIHVVFELPHVADELRAVLSYQVSAIRLYLLRGIWVLETNPAA